MRFIIVIVITIIPSNNKGEEQETSYLLFAWVNDTHWTISKDFLLWYQLVGLRIV